MNTTWIGIRNLLVVKADNLGDLIMSSPAIRAFKESFGCRITVLTSSMATGIADFISEIDEIITYDLPWVKLNSPEDDLTIDDITELLREKRFDAAVVFTVFSQNSLPASMLCYMAGIPLRLAYCRENPYKLLTHWLPDKEPYTFIQHQVQRDLALAASVGAHTTNLHYDIPIPAKHWQTAKLKMSASGIDLKKPWIILHAGVSEKKRQYPNKQWVNIAKQLITDYDYQVVFTGTNPEKKLVESLAAATGQNAIALAGVLTLAEFIITIQHTPLIVSVNTGTIHIAAATNTPVVVLYARTNPQHTPWMVNHKIIEFDVPESERSNNEVLKHLYETIYKSPVKMPDTDDVLRCIEDLLKLKKQTRHFADNVFR